MAFWAVARTASQREQTAQHFLKLEGYESYLPCIARYQVMAGRRSGASCRCSRPTCSC